MAWDEIMNQLTNSQAVNRALRLAKTLGGSNEAVLPVQEPSYELKKPFVKTGGQHVKQSKISTTPNVDTDDAARAASVPGYQNADPAALQAGNLDAQILDMQNKIAGLKRLRDSGVVAVKTGQQDTPKGAHLKRKQRVVTTDPKTGNDMYID